MSESSISMSPESRLGRPESWRSSPRPRPGLPRPSASPSPPRRPSSGRGLRPPPAPRPGPALTEMGRFRRPDPRPALKQKNKNKTHGPVTKGTNWNLKVACAYRLSIQRDSRYGRLSPGTAWRAGAQAGAPAEKKKKKSPESLGRGGGTSSDREGQENV